MFATDSIRRPTILMSVLSTALIMAGCSGSSGESIADAVDNIFTTPQTVTPEAPTPGGETPQTQPQQPTEQQQPPTLPPGGDGPSFDSENDDGFTEIQCDNGNVFIVDEGDTFDCGDDDDTATDFDQPTNGSGSGGLTEIQCDSGDVIFIDEGDTFDCGDSDDAVTDFGQPTNGGGSAEFQALQRLTPATRFEYTTTSDGGRQTVTFDFTNSNLVDEGSDTFLVLAREEAILVCGFFPQEDIYTCFDVFSNGLTFLTLFTLEANNTGTGTFSVCRDFDTDSAGCVDELINAPQGTAAVFAGLQSAFAITDNQLSGGTEYLNYLAQSEPVVTARSGEDLSELTELLLEFANLAMDQ